MEPRVPVSADDPRIERVFEISRVPKRTVPKDPAETGNEGEEHRLLEGWVEQAEGSSETRKGKEKETGTFATGTAKWGMGKGKEKEKDTGRGAKGKVKCGAGIVQEPRYARAPTPDDSSEDDRHEDDAGFPEVNEGGKYLKMQVSERARFDFAEIQCDHLGGPLWEILTGIEARTKFSNTELKHEGMFRNVIGWADWLLIRVSHPHLEAPAKLSPARQQLPEVLHPDGYYNPCEEPFVAEGASWRDSEETDQGYEI